MNNQPLGPQGFDRDRDREIEEQQYRQRALQQQQEDNAQREREHNERHERERQHRDQQHPPSAPHQGNTSAIPLHQPVASRLPGAIHSPGGLLANHGGSAPSGPLGAPSGPGNAFGGPLHSEATRSIQHNPQSATNQLQQQQGFGPSLIHHNPVNGPNPNSVPFGGPLQQQQQQQQQQQAAQAQAQAQAQQDAVAARLQQALPFGGPPMPQGHQIPGATALGQSGQQPILNDALSYLDQVKVQFADQPDVYNRFLDIMKDFKSQAIDTPGVINRVSDLFAGHPNLIQGFNTFLPPGYRIECGTGPDPNTIRVTTPMGTTVQSITGAGRALPGAVMGQQGSGNGNYYDAQRNGNWQQQPQHSIESPEAVFSPQNQTAGPAYGQNPAHISTYETQAAAAAAQQRGVNQLTTAANIMQHPPRNVQTPTPGAQAGMNGNAQAGEKRGPVEFNHAISYVNKIKNRFQDRPEIYKQFLEILQTYQRESKPIQDVYAQVTHLFNTAPDLLEDFKQFLPESAAQAKAAAAAKAMEEQLNQTPRSEIQKMPPVGNFSVPASISKDNVKKRQRPTNPNPSASQPIPAPESNVRGIGGPINKRAKLHHQKSNAQDVLMVSPTLTPIIPEALPPTSSSAASIEELSFFDRVKKWMNNKAQMNEFLKLCNLFSQDLIDKNVLISRASVFIGPNPEIMKWLKEFLAYDGKEENIENKPVAPSGRVALSNCRGLGPSYRLLPKRERLKPCSGRDEMCNEVLNDDWASHPTWASEDSGFVAHRKNTFEECLHRIEEERHDYDFNIEANSKVIQILEPIAQTILSLTGDEREAFRMPIGNGGQSQSIFKRVFKKIYQERGPEVVADLFKDPCAVLPIVLGRLKQKDEEWRFTQREWEKVWASQTQQMYLKSLDHMGIQVKQMDKKNFSTKHLLDAIKTKYEEQKRARSTSGITSAGQFIYDFSDEDVIIDVIRLMILIATSVSQHQITDRGRVLGFFEKFIPAFFGISQSAVHARTQDIDRGTPDDDEDVVHYELSNGTGTKSRKQGPGKKSRNLVRDVLDKGRNGRGRAQNGDSASGSKESTPDVDSVAEDDTGDAEEDQASTDEAHQRWISVAGAVDLAEDALSTMDYNADEEFARSKYSLWANQTIFSFFSIFQTIYRRLTEIKNSEEEARQEGLRSTARIPAREIGLLTENRDLTYTPLAGQTYYSQALRLVEDFITNEVDEVQYQNWLRRHYLRKGWQLYTITELLRSLCKLAHTCTGSESKDKSVELLEKFYENRQSPTTTYNKELQFRALAVKRIKDLELFVIKWDTNKRESSISWINKEDTTFDPKVMSAEDRWRYYVASWQRFEPTEGVPRNERPGKKSFVRTVLTRNLRDSNADSEDPDLLSKPLDYNENLTLRICANSYKLYYRGAGSEYYNYMDKRMDDDPETNKSAARERMLAAEVKRTERFKEKFEMNNAWMKGLSHEEVARVNETFNRWVKDGIVPVSGQEDVEMS